MSSKAPVKAPAPQPAPAPEPQISAFEQLVETHFRSILIGAGAIAAACLVWGGISYMSNRSAETAAIEAAGAKTVEDCDLVVQHHPGSVAAGNALLTKAKLLWDQNKKDTAVAVLRDFTAKYSSHPFIGQASIGLASRLEAMGGKSEVAEAKGIYEKVAKENPKADVGALAQMRLADMLWNDGKKDEAKAIYESLPSTLIGSPFFDHNKSRLDWYAANLPEKEVNGPKPIPELIKAPTPGAPVFPHQSRPFNVDELAKEILGNTGIPGGIKVNANKPSRPRPVARPATPKPGAITPGSSGGIPISIKPGANGAPATVTSQPIKVEVPAPKPAAAPAPAAPAPAK